MAIRAYDETYLSTAQSILGHAVDFAVMSLELDPDVFGFSFAVAASSMQFAAGNPDYVAGINGCELTRIVLKETQTPFRDAEDAMYLDKSPEYWAGWALAYYQWSTSYPFIDILMTVPLSEIILMYPVFHEMDISQFTDHMNELMRISHPETRLKTRRLNHKMSQSDLAKASGVALRQIQLFEQRQRNINNAAAITLLQLSRSLHCKVEDLMEY